MYVYGLCVSERLTELLAEKEILKDEARIDVNHRRFHPDGTRGIARFLSLDTKSSFSFCDPLGFRGVGFRWLRGCVIDDGRI